MDPMGSESQNSGTLRKTVTAVPPEKGAETPKERLVFHSHHRSGASCWFSGSNYYVILKAKQNGKFQRTRHNNFLFFGRRILRNEIQI